MEIWGDEISTSQRLDYKVRKAKAAFVQEVNGCFSYERFPD
jgi:hypothetical protein